MPKKKQFLSDKERRKRLREAERQAEASGDKNDFVKQFTTLVPPKRPKASN